MINRRADRESRRKVQAVERSGCIIDSLAGGEPNVTGESQAINGGYGIHIFAYRPHIERRREKISGLGENEFNEAYEKAAGIGDRILKTEGNKMDAFVEHFVKEVDEYFRHYGGKMPE